jgi:glycosyltransferase involved in cell wall biosynthesis
VSPPLRIGVDARELLGDTTGVGRYLGELMRRWAVRPDAPARRLLLYAPEAIPLSLPAGAVEQRVGGTGRGTLWEQTWLRRTVRSDRPDVFFAPAYTAPLGIRVPLAVTIHDISFVAHPEWFRQREGLRRRWLTACAAATAAVVFTDSAFSRSEIEQHFAVHPSRVFVIPPGLTPRSAAADSLPRRSADAKAGRREPLVLFVGSLFNRRRLPDLIAAFARATKAIPAARLVIVGDDRSWPPQDLLAVAHAYGVEQQTEFLDYVHDDRLAELYAQASVFGFLSEYEGFGLTPLEAMAAGVPSVVLDTPVAREVYGDAAVYVPPDDVHAAADALERLLTSADARADVLSHAPDVLSRYSWETAAAETLQHIEAVAAVAAPDRVGETRP